MSTGRQGMRIGVNYVPSSAWFYRWLDLDVDEVRRDLDDIASLGADHIRIFPIWPWIQPHPGHIRPRAVEDVRRVIDAAAQAGLDVAVDLIQGHLSSFDFLPSWILTWHRASIFADRRVRDALAEYVSAMAAAISECGNAFAISLGNEVNNLWPASETTIRQSHDWATELLAVARENAPGLLAVHSLFDDAFYAPDHPFSATDVTDLGDLSSVHSWVFNGTSAIDGPLGPATVSHPEYLVELARAFAADPARRVWLQEIGAPLPDIPAGDAAEFTRKSLEPLLGRPDLFGITWWCSHDINRRLRDFPEREYDLGLFDVEHRRKPAGHALASLIAASANPPPQPAPTQTLLSPPGLPGDSGSRRLLAPGSEFHLEWVRRRTAGPVGIVPAHRAEDGDYLRARGMPVAAPAGVPDPA